MLTDKLPSVSHAGSVQKIEAAFNNTSFDAGVVELVDTPDLGSGGESRGGSSPFTRTKRVIIVNTRSRDVQGTE